MLESARMVPLLLACPRVQDIPSEAVVCTRVLIFMKMGIIEILKGRHLLDHRSRQDRRYTPGTLNPPEEAHQVDGRRDPAPVGVEVRVAPRTVGHLNLTHGRVDGINECVPRLSIISRLSLGPLFPEGLADLHPADSQGDEDHRVYIVLVGLSRDLFDDAAEDVVAEVRVDVIGSGIVLEDGLAHPVPDDGPGVTGRRQARIAGDFKTHELGIAGNSGIPPAAVPQEVAYGDVRQARVRSGPGERGEVVENGEGFILQVDFPLLDQFEDAYGGEGLGRACDAEEGFGFGAGPRLPVRKTVSLDQDKAPVFHNGQGTAGDIPFLHEFRNDIVESAHFRGAFTLRGEGEKRD